MARTTDYDFLAPESAVRSLSDRHDFPGDTDTHGDVDTDDVFDELASGLYDEGVEHEVRELLGRVFGM
jgi:hypothetical protein